jgi:hypothetical protein
MVSVFTQPQTFLLQQHTGAVYDKGHSFSGSRQHLITRVFDDSDRPTQPVPDFFDTILGTLQYGFAVHGFHPFDDADPVDPV